MAVKSSLHGDTFGINTRDFSHLLSLLPSKHVSFTLFPQRSTYSSFGPVFVPCRLLFTKMAASSAAQAFAAHHCQCGLQARRTTPVWCLRLWTLHTKHVTPLCCHYLHLWHLWQRPCWPAQLDASLSVVSASTRMGLYALLLLLPIRWTCSETSKLNTGMYIHLFGVMGSTS